VFDVGLGEIAVILVVALVVVGPDKLPDLARQAARILQQVRRLANNARDDLRQELGPEYADLELRDLDPRVMVRKHILEAMEEEQEAAGERPPARQVPARLPAGERPPFDPEAT